MPKRKRVTTKEHEARAWLLQKATKATLERFCARHDVWSLNGNLHDSWRAATQRIFHELDQGVFPHQLCIVDFVQSCQKKEAPSSNRPQRKSEWMFAVQCLSNDLPIVVQLSWTRERRWIEPLSITRAHMVSHKSHQMEGSLRDMDLSLLPEQRPVYRLEHDLCLEHSGMRICFARNCFQPMFNPVDSFRVIRSGFFPIRWACSDAHILNNEQIRVEWHLGKTAVLHALPFLPFDVSLIVFQLSFVD